MNRARFVMLASTVLTTAGLGAPLAAHAQATSGLAPATASPAVLPGSSSLDEIVVTARRRAENIQQTPVSIAAVTGQAIERAAVTNITQLMTMVPGVNLTGSGSTANSVFSIRGMSRGVVGNAPPAVATYINDVPTSTWGAVLPTYDVANVQVLKGPQGTLFGKNTTAGAILLNTREPSYQFGGWAQVIAGRYDWRDVQGALNVPLVADKLALRVAADIDRRDGYTKNMSAPGADFDDIHDNNFRISLRADPTSNLKNVTVFDSTESINHGAGIVPYQYTPGGFYDLIPWTNGQLKSISPLVFCNGDPICDVKATAARQAAAGPRAAWDDMPAISKLRTQSLINTTTLDIGPVTLKNIFGWRKVGYVSYTNTDGFESSLLDAIATVNNRQYSEEFQASGKALNNTLTYVGGFFWLKSKPSGPNSLLLQVFGLPGAPLDAPGIGPLGLPNGASGNADFYTDTSKAVYGQVNYAFSDIFPALAGLSTDIGLRYTWDDSTVCTVTSLTVAGLGTEPSDCVAANSAKAKSSKLTYTLGLNYQATQDVLVYGVVRRGYRAGGVNPPKLGGLLTPFQTYAPEVVSDIELGLKTSWRLAGMNGRFNVAAYNSRYKNLQAGLTTGGSADPDGDANPFNNPSNQTLYVNAGSAKVRGVEADFALKPVEGLELNASGTVIDKKIVSVGVALPSTLPPFTETELASFAFLGSPKYSLNAGATYTSHVLGERGDLVFSATYFKLSSVQFGSVMAPAYDRVDLHLDWNHVMGSGVDASIFATNVGNKVTVRGPNQDSVGLGLTTVFYNEPRIIGVRLHYAFGDER